MAIASDELIKTTRSECLRNLAELDESLDSMRTILSVHPEIATAAEFAKLRALLNAELELKHRLLWSVVDVCDAILKERGQS